MLVGLDGATFTLLDPLMRVGVMPFLKKFVAEGVRAELLSVIPPLTPPAWTSLVTGRSPGHHGIFDFFQKEEKGHHIRFATSEDVRCETIWSIASRQGRKVTTLNFPFMLPPPEIDGNVIAGGWMTPRQLRLGCHPHDLYDKLKGLPGFDARKFIFDMAHEEKAIEGCRQYEYADWIKSHIQREHQWFGILKHLMREDPCDLTAILIDGVDKIQHLCWRYLAPDCVSKKLSSWEIEVRKLCLEYFSTLDQALVEIAALAGPDCTMVIASDHGFGAQSETFFVNTWLEQNGYLTWASESPPRESESSVFGMGQLARHVHMLDWDRTLAYASTPSSNGIHIVVADDGNERGVPPEEYDRFRTTLIESLYMVTNPATGEPWVTKVWTREEAFDGPYVKRAPDLTLSLRDGGLISILASDVPIKTRNQVTGTHRFEGVFMAKGPGIRRGRVLPQMAIVDVAPLLLYTLGLPVPRQMEGRMPAGVFHEKHLERHAVQVGEISESGSICEQQRSSEMQFDPEEEAEIAKQLWALGYME